MRENKKGIHTNMKREEKIKFSDLTEKQQETIAVYIGLEKKYGKGNIFIKYIKSLGDIFIIHGKGDFEFNMLQGYRIHGKVAKSLEEKGLTSAYDTSHRVIDPNDLRVIHVGAGINLDKIDFKCKQYRQMCKRIKC